VPALFAAAVVGMTSLFPDLLPVPAARWDLSHHLSASWSNMAGVVAGSLLGLAVGALDPTHRRSATAGFTLLGACLGWQSVIAFALPAIVAVVAVRRFDASRVGAAAILFGIAAA